MLKSPKIFLSDNGSLRPDATLALRSLADELSERIGHLVEPVSVLHSHKVDSDKLGGTPARIFKPTLNRYVNAGERHFVIIPLFLGPSLAITGYLPEVIEAAQSKTSGLKVSIAEPLAGASVESPDFRLAAILAENVGAVIQERGMERPKVALVDHGTPVRAVNQLRDAVASQLSGLLGDSVSQIVAASMERREGADYAFNEPLLENLPLVEGFAGGELIAAMFFLLPGRHAGQEGDVAEICEGLAQREAFAEIAMTELLGASPQLLDILEDRVLDALARLSASCQ